MRRSSGPTPAGIVYVLAGLTLLACQPGCSKSAPDGQGATGNGSVQAISHAHAVAGETCFICDPAKREPGRLWCREHGRYEDRCWICQPQLEDKSRPFCNEHFLYEDECFLCHPELEERETKASDSAESSSSRKTPGSSAALFCREHRVPEAECGICQPQRTKELKPGQELKVRLESNRAAEKAGLRTVKARPTETRASVGAICEVRYNENELARITPLAPGIVRRVLADAGSRVSAGDVLVEIHSADVARAKTAFISASVDAGLKELACKREERLLKKKISSEREFQEADAACKTAKLTLNTTRQTLLNYGFTEQEIAEIQDKQDGSATLLVRAPYDGTLVERKAVIGEAVEPGDPLFTLADLTKMWLALSIPADRTSLVSSGLEVEATFSAVPGLKAGGSITWVDTSIDEKSRLMKARAVVPNSEGKLKAGMFGQVRILLSASKTVLEIPRGAIQRFESRPYVFVRLEDDLYALRRVMIEPSSESHVAVVAGLQPDEPLVVDGAFTVMSEFLKSRLGAGCVDD